mgnify:CR=1 FL=1
MSSLVYRSAVASLLAQLLIGAVTSAGFFLPLPEDRSQEDLRIILALEVASQAVELLWYAVVVCRRRRISTWTRYLDWFVSTPLMLVTTAMFFYYRASRPVLDVLQTADLWASLGLNWLMLGFGLALELGALSTGVGVALGGAALVGSFTFLARLIVETDALSAGLYAGIFVVWALYGVAAVWEDDTKNIGYNALDVVSKNCYGLFLFLYIVLS